jgi:alkanesulfonate monooxygenase SsuD/methylene tetrahydromethanopterin reductase-like flavin-dependent oxidoreductase (luciferase family)
MHFGIFDHMDDRGIPLGEQIAERLRLVEAYDRLGFHAYHLAEHHGTPLGLAPSPSVFMAAVAQRTSRLRFGPLVYLLPLYHPLRLLEEICLLDQMSGGRFELGVGRGISPIEVGFFGDDPADGRAQFAEALAVLRTGFSSEVLSYHGKFYNFEDVPMALHPVQQPHPPLWYGVERPDSTAWAAANDANIVTLLPSTPARAVTDAYRAEWATCGKPVDALPHLGIARHMVLAEDEAEARRVASRAYRRWRTHMEWLWLRKGVPFPLTQLPTEFGPLAEIGAAFAGTPAGARDYVAEQVAAAGATYFVCDVAFGDLTYEESLRTTELLGREVLPAFADGEAISR